MERRMQEQARASAQPRIPATGVSSPPPNVPNSQVKIYNDTLYQYIIWLPQNYQMFR